MVEVKFLNNVENNNDPISHHHNRMLATTYWSEIKQE